MTQETHPDPGRLQLSVVIPAYNEEKTLARHFDHLVPVLDALFADSWEVLVFDDGSLDRTAAVVAAYDHPRISVLSHRPNRGKGAAVRAGILASRGELVLLCDADMATPPSMLQPFCEALRQGAAIVIGNRKDPRSRIARRQTPLRRFLGNIYIRLSARLTATAIKDFNCGFKLFRGDIARELLAATRSARWSYDIELLALAARRGYRIAELPVAWRDGEGSSVRLPGDAFKTLWEMLRIWVRLRRATRTR